MEKTKTTFVISFSDLVKNLADSTLELLRSGLDYYNPQEFCLDLESFSEQMKSLTEGEECFEELQKLFREGYSAMLLEASEIESLEKLDKNGEDYQLLITDLDNKALGLLDKEDISW
jgi:hypothetical protein